MRRNEDYDLRGSVLVIQDKSALHNFTSNWHFYNGTPVNDRVSSIINRSNKSVVAAAVFNNDPNGDQSFIDPGEQMNFKGRYALNELQNDTMSSIYVP